MRDNAYAIAAVAVMAGVTLLLRVLPFWIFREGKTPAYIEFLGKYLPYSIMGMLVVYCLKDISFTHVPFGVPEFLAVILTASLHIWKRNTLLSIVSGTLCYMALIRFV